MDLKSLVIYLITFSIAIFFTKLTEMQIALIDSKSHVNRNKAAIRITVIIFSIIVVFTPCILAALRDVTVGTDISGYILPNFSVAKFTGGSFFEFYKNMPNQTEIFFAFLIYICGKYFNLPILFFLIEFLVFLPTYLAAFNFRNEISISSSVTIYLFLFYNFSLSGMRQSIAMAFLLLAFSYYYKKSNTKAIVFTAAAFLFHSSVIIVVAIVLIVYFIESSKYRKQLYACLAAALVALFFFYRNIALIAYEIVSFVNPRYGYYIMRYLNNGFKWEDVIASELLFKTLIFCIALFSIMFFYKNKKGSIPIVPIAVICLFGRYFTVFNANMYESLRLAYYFDYLLILLVPMVKRKCYSKNFGSQIVINGLITMPVFLYWLYFIMYIGAYGTNNFIFSS